MTKREPVKLSRARMYDIIRSPVITEKSTIGGEHGQVTFRVPLEATKPEIKVEICSECHTFFTGEQRIVDTAGRVDKFQQRAAKAKALQEARADAKDKKKKQV